MKVAINGLGCIGRNFMCSWHGHKCSSLEITAINDITGVGNVCYNRGGEAFHIYILDVYMAFLFHIYETGCIVLL